MSENGFELVLATPDGEKFRGNITQLSVRGVEGDIGVLKGHIPFITAVIPHECRLYLPDGKVRAFRCGAGFLNVAREAVTMLSSTIEFLGGSSE